MDTLGHLTAAVSRTLDLQRFDSLIDALWEATTLVAKFHRTRDFEVSYKGADDPVTRADVAAHEVVAARLTSLYPAEFDSGRMYLISEEDHGRHEDPLVFEQQRKPLNRDGSVWLLDPIDGTKEFVSGQGDFTVNLALIRNESPMLGIVTLPERYEGDQKAQSEMMFVGVVGLGAYECVAIEFLTQAPP
ncbi:MAG: uncharacterized protein KVP18_001239 [Porospora cf. gigantea A]|uniref:uncharacterized protein n=1 Tax=Porospora cf. gigantea A TaxID=2853593 RepID=UPI003559EF9C|nr:MAG: hypothetical protein KVP18_001239 [Porospora cf. gigantea A]